MIDRPRIAFSDAELRQLINDVLAQPRAVASLSPVELDLILVLFRRVKLLGWLAAKLDDAGELGHLPEAAVEQLSSVLIMARGRAQKARWELDRIAWALRALEPIAVIALKGCAYLLHDLPNARGRLFADVDLLVEEADLRNVETTLSNFGWQPTELTPYDDRYYRDWSHELPAMVHVERDIEVDVHHNIRGPYAPFKPDPSLLMRDAIPVDGSLFQTLSEPDLVLHSMTHLIYSSDLADRLRELVDIAELVEDFSSRNEIFWVHLNERAAELDLGLPLFYGLRYLVRLLNSPVPESALAGAADFKPSPVVIAIMDRLVPLALYPPHPDSMGVRMRAARMLLYVRSHWVSMPKFMLFRHLVYKFFVRRLKWRFGSEAEVEAQ